MLTINRWTRVRKFATDNAIALSSFVVAAVALFNGINQASTTEYHNRLSLMPLVFIQLDQTGDALAITFENVGLGPAILKGFDVIFLGQEFNFREKFDWQALLKYARGKLDSTSEANRAVWEVGITKIAFGEPSKFYTIKKEGFLSLAQTPRAPDNPEGQAVMREIMKNIAIRVCYRSVYGDFIVVNSKGIETKKSCADEVSFNLFGYHVRFKWPWERPITWESLFGS